MSEIVGRHTEKEWFALLYAWNWRCFYCGNSVRIRFMGCALEPEHEATKDHLVPIVRGGVDFIENIVPACLRCNRMKGRQTAEEFRLSRPAFPVSQVEKENFRTGNAFVKPSGLPPEQLNEPGLLKKLQREREQLSWYWSNPA